MLSPDWPQNIPSQQIPNHEKVVSLKMNTGSFMNRLFPQSKIYLNYYKHQRTQCDTDCAYKALYFSGTVLKELGPEEDI